MSSKRKIKKKESTKNGGGGGGHRREAKNTVDELASGSNEKILNDIKRLYVGDTIEKEELLAYGIESIAK